MANNKNITFDQLQSSMTKIKGEIDKKANTNHGTHVKYYDDNPKVAGTVTAGNSSRLSRGDHVHPAQTTITGNAGTATALATARTLTIGNTGKSFDGSASVSWSLNEIGAASNTHSHNFLNIKGSNTISSTANDTTANWTEHGNSIHWYSTSEQLINQPSEYGFLVNLASGGDVHQIWMTQSAGNMYHRGGNGSGWNGDTWRTILDSSNFTSYSPTLSGGGAIGTWGISISGNASNATKLQNARTINGTSFNGTADITTANWGTSRTLTIGSSGKSVNGSANVSWSLDEMGVTSAIQVAENDAKMDILHNYVTKHEAAHYFEGENKWKLDVYSLGSMSASAYPTKETMIQNNCQYQRSYLVEHPSHEGEHYGDNYVGYATTYMHFTSDYQWNGRVVTDDNGNVYLNDVLVLSTPTCQWVDITLNFKAGWNKLEVLYAEGGGGDGWQFSPEIVVVPGGVINKMNCYGQNSIAEHFKYVASKSHTHTNLVAKTVSSGSLTLGTELYQYAAISSATTINLPSVSSFTEIHLFFNWPANVSVTMPSGVKWQQGVMYGPGHVHEFVFTYVNNIGWLGGCVVYG